MMIPKRIAIVRTIPGSSHTSEAVTVSVVRLPWEMDIEPPDDRIETKPRTAAIRNPDLDETCGPMCPAKSMRLAQNRAGRPEPVAR